MGLTLVKKVVKLEKEVYKNEKINKFYLSKTTYLVFAFLAIAGWVAWGVNAAIMGNFENLALAVILLALTVELFIAYKNGETNVQKTLLGALLMFLVVNYMDIAFDQTYTFNKVISIIITLLLVLVFICHIHQQMDHTGHSMTIMINQFCGLIVAVRIVFDIYLTINHVYYTGTILWSLSLICTLTYVICIETRVGEYKKVRLEHKSNNTWTDEERAKAKEIFKI